MTVICDRIYEAEDYISDYQLFKEFASKLNNKVKNWKLSLQVQLDILGPILFVI